MLRMSPTLQQSPEQACTSTLHLLVEVWCASAFLTSDAAVPGTRRTQAGTPLRPDSTWGVVD